MKVLEQMSLFTHQRNEKNNVAIAARIAEEDDYAALKQIVQLLQEGNTALKNDCIKIIYEVGEQKPLLIEEYLDLFFHLLKSKNNRLQWGAMCAIYYCAQTQLKKVYKNLDYILKNTENASVIGRDYRFFTLITLAKEKKYLKTIAPVLIDELWKAAENQFPAYCEETLCLPKKFIRETIVPIISERIKSIATESKRKRLNKILKKFSTK
jgi:hypothetical protein